MLCISFLHCIVKCTHHFPGIRWAQRWPIHGALTPWLITYDDEQADRTSSSRYHALQVLSGSYLTSIHSCIFKIHPYLYYKEFRYWIWTVRCTNISHFFLTFLGRKPSFTHLNYQQPPLTKLPVCYFRCQQLICNWGSMFWNCILTVLTMDFAHIRSTYSTFPSFYCLMPYSCNRKSGWLLDLSHVVFTLSTIQTL